MDPVTHFLTGACLGRAGLNRKTAYATLAATLAAEAPDIDVVASVGGPVTGFAHHRGITHTLVGAPVMALLITATVFGIHRLWRKRPPEPVRWGWVWLVALVADLSHLLLDLTNNYGLRPFYPFNPRWYSLDLVFIIEPVLLLVLALALVLPAIFGLVEQEQTRQRTPFRGRGLAIGALTLMAGLWVLRNAEHAHAIALAKVGTPETGPLARSALRFAAEPYPIDPFHWHVIAETPDGYQTAEVHTLSDRLEPDEDMVAKSPVTRAVAAAKQSQLGRVYLDWSGWPLTADLGSVPAPGGPTPPDWRAVRFTDMRFAYSRLGMSGGDEPVLAGWVYVDAASRVQEEVMNGRTQN